MLCCCVGFHISENVHRLEVECRWRKDAGEGRTWTAIKQLILCWFHGFHTILSIYDIAGALWTVSKDAWFSSCSLGRKTLAKGGNEAEELILRPNRLNRPKYRISEIDKLTPFKHSCFCCCFPSFFLFRLLLLLLCVQFSSFHEIRKS